jgi:hypothetical protein
MNKNTMKEYFEDLDIQLDNLLMEVIELKSNARYMRYHVKYNLPTPDSQPIKEEESEKLPESNPTQPEPIKVIIADREFPQETEGLSELESEVEKPKRKTEKTFLDKLLGKEYTPKAQSKPIPSPPSPVSVSDGVKPQPVKETTEEKVKRIQKELDEEYRASRKK